MLDAAEIALELARIEREAFARVRARMSAQQLGEAWIGLDGYFSDRSSTGLPDAFAASMPYCMPLLMPRSV